MHETRIRQLHGSGVGRGDPLSADGVDVDGILLTMNSSGSRVLVTWSEASGALKAAVVDDGVAVTRSISPSVDDVEYAYALAISADGTTLAVVWSRAVARFSPCTSTDGGVTWGTAKTLVTTALRTAAEACGKHLGRRLADRSHVAGQQHQCRIHLRQRPNLVRPGDPWASSRASVLGRSPARTLGTRFAVAWTNSNARGTARCRWHGPAMAARCSEPCRGIPCGRRREYSIARRLRMAGV